MQLEVGKYYRTRGGHKAIVSAIVPPSPDGNRAFDYPVLGYLWRNGRCWPASWTLEGRVSLDGQEHGHDLVAPRIIDPPKVKVELAEKDINGSPRVLVTIGAKARSYDFNGRYTGVVDRKLYTNIRPYEPASR